MANGQENNTSNLVYKIASFLLILLIGYFANSVVTLQKFGFENRERIVKIEARYETLLDNQRELLIAQREMMAGLNAIKVSLMEDKNKK